MTQQTYVVIGEGRTENAAMADFYKKAAIRAGRPLLKSDQIHVIEGKYRDDGTYKAQFYVKVNGHSPTAATPGVDPSKLEKHLLDDPFR